MLTRCTWRRSRDCIRRLGTWSTRRTTLQGPPTPTGREPGFCWTSGQGRHRRMAGTKGDRGTPSSNSSPKTSSSGKSKFMHRPWHGWHQVQGDSQRLQPNSTPWSQCREVFKHSTLPRRAMFSLHHQARRRHEGKRGRNASVQRGRSSRPTGRKKTPAREKGNRKGSQNRNATGGTTGQARVDHCRLGSNVRRLSSGCIDAPSATARATQADPGPQKKEDA